MNKTTAIAGIAILVILVFVLGGCAMNRRDAKYDTLQLEEFSTNTSGGMSGAHSTLVVRLDKENDCVTVYSESNNWWSQDAGAECCVVDMALLEDIKQIILDTKLYNAEKAPISEMQVLDAPTTYWRAYFSEGEGFYYTSSQMLQNSVYEAQKQILAVIDAYRAKGTQYPTVAAPEDEEPVDWKEEGTISLHVVNYGAFSINMQVNNGTETAFGETTELNGDVVVSKLVDGQAVSSTILQEDLTLNVYGDYVEDVYIHIPKDAYLEEGTYLIEYAGYEATFEMKVYPWERW